MWLGQGANLLFHDANAALVAISIAAACGALFTIYALAYNWFGRSVAAFAGLMFSPLTWFHGTVALTYGVEQFFSGSPVTSVAGLQRGAGFIVPAALAVGLGAGFRPSFFSVPGVLGQPFEPREVARGRCRARRYGGGLVRSYGLGERRLPRLLVGFDIALAASRRRSGPCSIRIPRCHWRG